MDLNKLNTTELIHTYSEIIKQLKKRRVIRTKNLLGDLGEYLAIEHFNKTQDYLISKLHLLALKTLMQLVEMEKDIV